jgi:hypothetical protein
VLLTGRKEITLLSFRLVVADRVGRVLRVSVVAALGVHGAIGSNRTVLVVRKILRASPTIAVTRATACRGHFEGEKRLLRNMSKVWSFRMRRIGPTGYLEGAGYAKL